MHHFSPEPSSIGEQKHNSKNILPQNNIFCNIKSRVLPKKSLTEKIEYTIINIQHKNKPLFAQNNRPITRKTA